MYNKFMQVAIVEALKSFAIGEVPVGAVVVKNGKIIGRGHNLKETKKDATEHAEINAIRDACKDLDNWRLDGCAIYVTLEPCPMCAGAILESRISKLYIGTNNMQNGAAGTVYNIVNKNTDVYFGIMENDTKKLINDFFSRLR